MMSALPAPTPSLPGTWHPVRAELDGELAPELALTRMELVLQDEARYAMRFAGETHDAGTFVSDEATLTFTANAGHHIGRVVPAIYQLAGNRLRICYGLNGLFPEAFTTTANSGRYLVTYRRG